MIADNVVIVRARITVPSTSIIDRALSDEIRRKTNAKGSLRVRKDYVAIKEVTKISGRMRRYLKEEGVPWSMTTVGSDGRRKSDPTYAIEGRKIEEVAEFSQQMREDWDNALLRLDYEEIKDERKTELADAYNEEDYPTEEEFFAKFSWNIEVVPLMDIADVEDDFRVRLPPGFADQQIESYKEAYDKRVENAVADVVERLNVLIVGDNSSGLGDKDKPGPVQRLKNFNPDEGDKRKGKTFKNKSIYANIDEFRDFVAGVHSFAESDTLEDIIDRLDHFRNKIRPVNPDAIRDDVLVRNKVIAGLMAVIMPSNDMPVTKAPVPSGTSGAAQFV